MDISRKVNSEISKGLGSKYNPFSLRNDVNIIANIDLQFKCKFEIIIYNDDELSTEEANAKEDKSKKEEGKGLTKLKNQAVSKLKDTGQNIKDHAVGMGQDLWNTAKNMFKNPLDTAQSNWVFRYYLHSISGVNLDGVEYTRVRGKQYASGVVYPDTFSMQFYEDSFGTVKNYMRKWQSLVAVYNETAREYFFRDNQAASKKTVVLIPIAKTGIPSEEWIMLKGVRPALIEGMEWEHSNSDPELISLNFVCDSARLYNLLPDLI